MGNLPDLAVRGNRDYNRDAKSATAEGNLPEIQETRITI